MIKRFHCVRTHVVSFQSVRSMLNETKQGISIIVSTVMYLDTNQFSLHLSSIFDRSNNETERLIV